MKKIIKFSTVLLLVFIIVFSMFSLNVFAAKTTISFSKNTVNVGDSVSVTVNISGNSITAADITLAYNPDVLNYTSGAESGGAGNVRILDIMGMDIINSKSYTIVFKAEKAGACQISVSAVVSEGNPAVDSETGASATLNVVNKVLSSNANLKSLRLGVGELSPAFSPDVTTYDVLIPNSATKCLVYATTADSAATLTVEGSSAMQVGYNKRVVIVTAPNGTQKSYTLNITRSDQPDSIENTSSTSSDASLQTSLDELNYTIATDISNVPLFKGFSISTALYNGTDVAIATDEGGNYKIYYLKSPDSEELIPCLLDNETNTFKKLKYATIGENTYIFEEFPEDKTVSSNYYSASAKIYGNQVKCYADSNTKLADFYYVYCFSNNRYGVYRYDSKEETLQRSPDFVLSDLTDDSNIDANGNIFARFSSLKDNAKIMVICLLVAILMAIALIVLLIIKIFKKNEYDDFDEDLDEDLDDEFESVTFNEDFVLENEETADE